MGRKSYLQQRTSNPRVAIRIRGDEDGVSSCLGGVGWGGDGCAIPYHIIPYRYHTVVA
jgi:hypothetical protein